MEKLKEVGKSRSDLFGAFMPNGNNALHESIRAKNFDMVNYLSSHKIDLNNKNAEGKTPLEIAQEVGDDSIVGLLRMKGFNSKKSENTVHPFFFDHFFTMFHVK